VTRGCQSESPWRSAAWPGPPRPCGKAPETGNNRSDAMMVGGMIGWVGTEPVPTKGRHVTWNTRASDHSRSLGHGAGTAIVTESRTTHGKMHLARGGHAGVGRSSDPARRRRPVVRRVWRFRHRFGSTSDDPPGRRVQPMVSVATTADCLGSSLLGHRGVWRGPNHDPVTPAVTLRVRPTVTRRPGPDSEKPSSWFRRTSGCQSRRRAPPVQPGPARHGCRGS
jgi:hypothetical protein